MIKLERMWIVHYKYEKFVDFKFTFQQQIDLKTNGKFYNIIDKNGKVEKCTMEEGNKRYKEMINKYDCFVNKIV